MKRSTDLARRLGRAFLLQAAGITLVAILGVLVTQHVLEHQLMREALRTEADYFWNRYEREPGTVLPHTRNLTGYLVPPFPRGDLPPWLAELEPGYHDLPAAANHAVAYVTQRGDRHLILVFDIEQVEQVALYFGLVPLAGLLVLLYLTSWLAYRSSRRLVSPVTRLTRKVQALDIGNPDAGAFRAMGTSNAPDHEVSVLAEALASLVTRLQNFVAREREFTRDASHELRTPLSVIKVAGQILEGEHRLSGAQAAEVARIRRAAERMEELVETFLVLAREDPSALADESVPLPRIVDEEIELNSGLLAGKPVEISHTFDGTPTVTAPGCVLRVLVGNLLRNAFSYTERGSVRVHVSEAELIVEDTGRGMTPEQVSKATELFFRGSASGLGHGIGLSVVKRLCDRFGWRFTVRSEPGAGTCAVVNFAATN